MAAARLREGRFAAFLAAPRAGVAVLARRAAGLARLVAFFAFFAFFAARFAPVPAPVAGRFAAFADRLDPFAFVDLLELFLAITGTPSP